MNKLLSFCLFALLLVCFSFQQAGEKIVCHPGKEMRYQYTSIIKSFSGKKQFDAQGNRIHQSRGEKAGVTATVCLTCTKKWKRADGKWDYLWNVRMEDVKMDMKLDDSSKWNIKAWKGDVKKSEDANVPGRSKEELEKYFTQTTAFLSSSNGKIYKIYHAKGEQVWVTSMKKTVIDQIQTKLNVVDEPGKRSRLEGNGVGLHKAHYKFHRNPKNGGVIIQKKYTDLDAKDATMRDDQNHREMKLKSKTSFVMSPKGEIKQSISKKKIKLGTRTHAPRHGADKYWFKRDYVPHAKSGNTYLENGDNHFLNGKEYTLLEYIDTIDFAAAKKQQMDAAIRPVTAETLGDEVLADGEKHPKIELSDGFVASTLIPEGIHEYALGLRKEYLGKAVNFAAQLKKLMEKPENLKKAAKLVEYLSHFKELAPKVHEAFEEIAKIDPNHEFLKLAQMILASIDTEEAQKLFMKTWINKSLIRHGIMKALEIKKPSAELVERLKSIYAAEQKPLSDTYSEAEKEDDLNLKLTSYLVMADLAARLPEKEATPIIEIVLENIMKNKTFDGTIDAIVHLHALGNAGERAPIEVILAIINSTTVNDRVKSIALQALRKRVSESEEELINTFVHDLIANPETSVFIKKSAIELQTVRETKKATGRSIQFFRRLLFETSQPESIKNAILDYMKANHSKKSAKIILAYAKYHKNLKKITKKSKMGPEMAAKVVDFVARAKYGEQDRITDEHFDAMVQFVEAQSDAMFLRRMWRSIRRAASSVGRAIGRAASSVGRAIGRAATTVGRAVGRVATAVVDVVKKGAEMVGKVGKVFDQIKAAFSAATFQGQQVCLPASRKPDDKICAYSRSMIDFIARQGDSSIFSTSKHASFEKLVGTNKINLYAGIVGLAGTNFDCNQPPSEFVFTIAARAEIAAKVFSKDINLVTAEGEMRMRGQFMDHVYVKVLDAVILSKELLPTEKINRCENEDKQLYQKNIGNLPAFSFTVMLGPIPVQFGFSITAQATVSKVAGYCTRNLKAEVGVVPSAGVGVAAHAAVSIFIAKAGIEVSGTFNYGLYPNFNIRGLECKACATLQHRVRPMELKIKAFAEVGLFGFSKKWDVTLVNWSSQPIDKVIVEACATFAKYKPKSDLEFTLPRRRIGYYAKRRLLKNN